MLYRWRILGLISQDDSKVRIGDKRKEQSVRNAFPILFLKVSKSTQCQDLTICWWGWEERKTCATCSGEDMSPDYSRVQGQEPASDSGHPHSNALTCSSGRQEGRQAALSSRSPAQLQPLVCPSPHCCPKRPQPPNPEGPTRQGGSNMREGVGAPQGKEEGWGFLLTMGTGWEA